MNLISAADSQIGVRIDGFDTVTQTWVEGVSSGSIAALSLVPRMEFGHERVLACSARRKLPEQYSLIRLEDGTKAILQSRIVNNWRGGIYQYVYELRIASFAAEVYRFVTQVRASGVAGPSARQLEHSTWSTVVTVGSDKNLEEESVKYAKVRIYLPGDLTLTEDYEIDIEGYTYGIQTLHRTPLAWEVLALRRNG